MNEQKKLTVYAARHGQTVFNLMGRIQGTCDSLLTAQGLEEANGLGRGLAGVRFGAVYASDLRRASKTAKAVVNGNTAGTARPMAEIPLLRETGFGTFEGSPTRDLHEPFARHLGIDFAAERTGRNADGNAAVRAVSAHFKRDMRAFIEAQADFVKLAGNEAGYAESAAEVYARAARALEYIASENPGGGNVLLVSHGQFLLFLLAGIGAALPPGRVLGNASVTLIEYDLTAKSWSLAGPIGDTGYIIGLSKAKTAD
jgi:probable phosphoglycerate mutase